MEAPEIPERPDDPENPETLETPEEPETQISPIVESAPSLQGRAGGEATSSPDKPLDPSRAFFNRVKNRFLQGLSSLTKEED